jgi:lipoic acid synthetase
VRARERLPHWLTKPLSDPSDTRQVRAVLEAGRLNTVCDEARCPNRADCFARGTATFMILGDRCTRDCRFCAVSHDDPREVDPAEPAEVAAAAAALGLDYVVVTSVTRDDLPDGGAGHFVNVMSAIREALPGAGVEVLVPDFCGDEAAVEAVLGEHPKVFGHNIETVSRLYTAVRRGADYRRSLGVLETAASRGGRVLVKSSVMLGVGESRQELEETLGDLREAGVEIVCLGQYLSPSGQHRPVERYVPPEEFDELAEVCRAMGFRWVEAGPFVRSSYRAHEAAAALLGMDAASDAAFERSEHEDQGHLQAL